MKNTESKSKENNLKILLAPYSKMGEQLRTAYCDSAELQNEFPLFYDFIFSIRKHYKDSPLHQEEVWVSLLKIRDTTIEALIYQRRDARETKKEKMPCYIKQTQKIAEALARECKKSWYNNMKEWKSRSVKENYLKLKKHIDRVDSIVYGDADTLDMLEEYLEFHGKAPLAKRIKEERNWYSKWAWQVSPEPIDPSVPNATPNETLFEFACMLELAVRKLAQTLAHVVNLTNMNTTARGKAGGNMQATSKTTKRKVEAIRDQVFICYSHKDKRWLEDLQIHLKPYVRNGSVTAWSDKQIAPGSKWLLEIKVALAHTKVAALIVTPYFLASDFIHENELTPLLKEAEKGDVRIIWIPVRACAYKETPLKDYQGAIDADKPLANMKADRDKAWVKICEEIKKAVNR